MAFPLSFRRALSEDLIFVGNCSCFLHGLSVLELVFRGMASLGVRTTPRDKWLFCLFQTTEPFPCWHLMSKLFPTQITCPFHCGSRRGFERCQQNGLDL